MEVRWLVDAIDRIKAVATDLGIEADGRGIMIGIPRGHPSLKRLSVCWYANTRRHRFVIEWLACNKPTVQWIAEMARAHFQDVIAIWPQMVEGE